MRDDMKELIAAYALDAVDETEAAAVEAAIAQSPELRDELEEYRTSLAVVATHTEPAPSTPSPAVWAAIQAEVGGTELRPARDVASVTAIRSSTRWSRWGAVIAVAAVAASLLLGVWVVDLQNQLDAAPTLDELASEAMTEPGALIVDLEGQEGSEDATARIVVGEDGIGYIVSDTLVALGSARTYQLWAIVADGGEQRVISAGVLGPDPGVSQFQAQADIKGFAITEEIAGGVAVSEAAPVAVWLREA